MLIAPSGIQQSNWCFTNKLNTGTSFFSLMSAFFFSRTSRSAWWPLMMAIMRAVFPSLSCALMSAPACSSEIPTSRWPDTDAGIDGNLVFILYITWFIYLIVYSDIRGQLFGLFHSNVSLMCAMSRHGVMCCSHAAARCHWPNTDTGINANYAIIFMRNISLIPDWRCRQFVNGPVTGHQRLNEHEQI